MGGPKYFIKFSIRNRYLLVGLLLSMVFSIQAQNNESTQEEKASLRYLSYLEKCKRFRAAGNIAQARIQLDSARYFFRRELGLSHPNRAFINIELSNIQQAEGNIGASLASLQRALGSFQANSRSEQLEFNPAPAFNLNDSIICRLLIKKSELLLAQARRNENTLYNLRLAKNSLQASLTWMQFMVEHGWWNGTEENSIRLLKQITSLGLQLSLKREEYLLEPLSLERSFWVQSYFQTKEILQSQALKPFPSALLPDSINDKLLKFQQKLLASRKEFKDWTDKNGSNNLQTVIIKENIKKEKNALDAALNEVKSVEPDLYAAVKCSWLKETESKQLPSCLLNKESTLSYFTAQDSVFCYYSTAAKDTFWTFPNQQFQKVARSLAEEVQASEPIPESVKRYEADAFELFKGLMGPLIKVGLPKTLWIIADHKLLDFPFEGLVYGYATDKNYEDLNYIWKKTNLRFQRNWRNVCFQMEYGSEKAKRYELGEKACAATRYQFSQRQISMTELADLSSADFQNSYWQINALPPFFKDNLEQQKIKSRLIIWNTENPMKWSAAQLSHALGLAGTPNLLFNSNFSCDKPAQYFWEQFYADLGIGIGKQRALDEAIETMVAKGGSYAVPKYWLGKRYLGDPLPLKKRYKIFALILLWISLGVASFILMLYLLKLRQKFLRSN